MLIHKTYIIFRIQFVKDLISDFYIFYLITVIEANGKLILSLVIIVSENNLLRRFVKCKQR